MVVVIKTFMRPDKCVKAIASARKYLPQAYVVVVDDSPPQYLREYSADELIVLPVDSGLSAGRNAGVDVAFSMNDPYVVIMDDDCELTSETQIASSICHLDEGADIVCGAFIQEGRIHHFEHKFVLMDRILFVNPVEGSENIDVGHNFILAKTDVFNCVKWDEQLKIEAEHLDFFFACKQVGVKVRYNPKMCVQHNNKGRIPGYRDYRLRFDYYPIFVQKWGLCAVIETGPERYHYSA